MTCLQRNQRRSDSSNGFRIQRLRWQDPLCHRYPASSSTILSTILRLLRSVILKNQEAVRRDKNWLKCNNGYNDSLIHCLIAFCMVQKFQIFLELRILNNKLDLFERFYLNSNCLFLQCSVPSRKIFENLKTPYGLFNF